MANNTKPAAGAMGSGVSQPPEAAYKTILAAGEEKGDPGGLPWK
jgi:hypothetical protein